MENKSKLIAAFLNLADSSSESDTEKNVYNLISRKRKYVTGTLEASTKLLTKRLRIRIPNYMGDVMDMYDEQDFKMHFRISLFESLTKQFENSDIFKKMHADCRRIPADKQIAIFLWFSGHEACSFRDIADRFNTPISSVSRVIVRMINFVSNLAPKVILWPKDAEKASTKAFFHNKCGFSKVIGCIDGSHIVIDPPADRKDDYIDRKGNITVCLQGICNEKRKFIDLFIGYPGSSHDSWVFQNSPIYENLSSLCGDTYLLGDSAYPCSPNLITPYKDNGNLTTILKAFNKKLGTGRVCIEHTFGILKQRFRQLYYCKLKGMEKVCHFIRACCVLHNLANENDLEFCYDLEDTPTFLNETVSGEIPRGRLIRDEICRELQNHN